jgi:hypothetical protein
MISRMVVDLTKRGYINDGLSKYCNQHHAVHDRGAELLESAGASQIKLTDIATLAMQHGSTVLEGEWREAYAACAEANRALDIAATKIGKLTGSCPPANGAVVFMT